MAKPTSQIAIIIPAFNEAAVIGDILESIPRHFDIGADKFTAKIIVVNDGSNDDTEKVVAKFDDVILINHILNTGAGGATRTGLHYARDIGCGYAITMDGDGQHLIGDVQNLVAAIVKSNDDFIIGSRLIQKSGNMPLAKKLGNLGLSFITFLLLGVYVSDSQSGLKALNRRALESLEFHSNNYAFCSEMIWKARQAKLRVSEVPITAIYTDYSKSRGQKSFTGAFAIIKQLIKRRFLNFVNE